LWLFSFFVLQLCVLLAEIETETNTKYKSAMETHGAMTMATPLRIDKNKDGTNRQSRLLKILFAVVAVCTAFVCQEFKILRVVNEKRESQASYTRPVRFEAKVETEDELEVEIETVTHAEVEVEKKEELPRKTKIDKTPSNEGTANIRKIPRLINDLSLDWNETMHRPWLSIEGENEGPPFMLLMTNVGWNHPNTTYGLGFPRMLRERELFQAIVNHPYFHPTAWEDIRNGTAPISATTNYYVFVDVLQCLEINYPNYGRGETANLDAVHNRSTEDHSIRYDHCWRREKYDLFKHPLFQHKDDPTTENATIVILNCNGGGPWCDEVFDLPMSIAAMGGLFPNMNIRKDQGLIPAAVNPIHLSPAEIESIANCDADADPHKRPLTATFVGSFRDGHGKDFNEAHNGGARTAYKPFHNPMRGFFITKANKLQKPENQQFSVRLVPQETGLDNSDKNATMPTHNFQNASYDSLLRYTKFALVPRGDDKFSYRFTEALGAGAIPVYHGDDHMLPFRPEVVDWNRCGLVLPEKDAGATTLELLKNLVAGPNATQTLCSMRQYCYFEIYEKYVASPIKQINGLVEGLEALARGERKDPVGTFCNETSIANLDCNPE